MLRDEFGYDPSVDELHKGSAAVLKALNVDQATGKELQEGAAARTLLQQRQVLEYKLRAKTISLEDYLAALDELEQGTTPGRPSGNHVDHVDDRDKEDQDARSHHDDDEAQRDERDEQDSGPAGPVASARHIRASERAMWPRSLRRLPRLLPACRPQVQLLLQVQSRVPAMETRSIKLD